MTKNMDEKKKEHPKYESLKKTLSTITHCPNCNGSYSSLTFYRHKRTCKQAHHKGISMEFIEEKDKEFRNILASVQRDDIGLQAISSELIKNVGKRVFRKGKGKVDKKQEVAKKVRVSMRLLASLYLSFKKLKPNSEVEDMFKREHIEALEEAVEDITSTKEGILHGKKYGLQYLISDAVQVQKGTLLMKPGNEDAAKELDNFQAVYDLRKSVLFSDALYKINKNRQENLKLPARSADESSMEKIRNYLVEKLKSDDLSFNERRNIACSRLTLFNARRGGEVSRMTIQNWVTKEKWLTNMEPKIDGLQVVYLRGKGNHTVSCFVTDDCVSSLDYLCNPDVRREAGVAKDNKFIFATCSANPTHVEGWDTINFVCKSIGIPTITATSQRIRLSTIYAGLDVQEKDRHHFYNHLGHSEAVNKGTYQRPLATLALEKVGKPLAEFDRGTALFCCKIFLCT